MCVSKAVFWYACLNKDRVAVSTTMGLKTIVFYHGLDQIPCAVESLVSGLTCGRVCGKLLGLGSETRALAGMGC